MRTQAAKNNNNNFTLKTYFYNYTIHIFSYSKHRVSRLLTDLCFNEWKKIVPLRSIFTLFNRFSSSPLWQLILNCAEERLSGYFFYFLCVCVAKRCFYPFDRRSRLFIVKIYPGRVQLSCKKMFSCRAFQIVIETSALGTAHPASPDPP